MGPARNTKPALLSVDDNPVNLRLAELILRKEGYEVISTQDALEGIDMAKSYLPDIILLDMRMPSMSGLEVCRILKGDTKAASIPIIFVTANTDNQTLKEAFAAGGNDYVKKPLNREELLARIGTCLRERALVGRLVEQE
ncbi:MAG: response regulator, partial [Deltaproteobacteria bacterium]